MNISIIIPAKNEELSIEKILFTIRNLHPESEIIVVDDGSTDRTAEMAKKYAKVISHPYSKGNGAAIKTGVRNATNDIIVCMDADGQHKPEDIEKLIKHIGNGYDMVVGARTKSSQASPSRALANGFYNMFSGWITGQKIMDLTSGFRAADARKFKDFLHLLPNGFSYPTTITMAFFRAGYSVQYVPIQAPRREGKSHINLGKDGIRFLLIIFKIGTLYSPLKIFVPISSLFFLMGMGYYAYTYSTAFRFTNMSALLLSISVIIFLIGLVSEQITTLIYNKQ